MSKGPDPLVIKDITDKALVADLLRSRWGSDTVFMHYRKYSAAELDAVGAYDGQGQLAGLATWSLSGSTVLLFTVDSFAEGEGIGSTLIEGVLERARTAEARKVRVVTTNDNLQALAFYQRRGFRLTALYPGAMDAYRVMTPTLRVEGANNIPCRDIIEMERDL